MVIKCHMQVKANAHSLADCACTWLLAQTCLQTPALQVEPGETPERALVRELHEELGIEVSRITGNKCRWGGRAHQVQGGRKAVWGAGGLLGIEERVGLGACEIALLATAVALPV